MTDWCVVIGLMCFVVIGSKLVLFMQNFFFHGCLQSFVSKLVFMMVAIILLVLSSSTKGADLAYMGSLIARCVVVEVISVVIMM